MQIARFGAHNIDWSLLPRVFPELRQVKLQPLQLRDHLAGGRTIDVESQDEQWMFQWSRVVDLTIFKNKNFASGKEDAISGTCRGEVDAQTTGHGHRLVPGFHLGGAIGLKIC